MGNKLEKLLQEASSDPGKRPAFYLTLLDSEVYVLGTAGDGEGQTGLEPGSSVQIIHWQLNDGTPVIPFFSSLEMLEKSIQQRQNYLRLKARDLFEMTRGMTLVLNPNQPHGKSFNQEEVAALLDGTLFQQTTTQTIQRETTVMLGQPRDYPQAFVDALSSLFATLPQVSTAYLAWMHDPSNEDPPHTIIGIEVASDYQAVVRQAGLVAAEVMRGEIVDFIEIESGGISDYMVNETRPFYKA